MILPGETEAGTAGTQPCRGIARWAHRDDERGREDSFLRRPNPHRIERPHALKIPARRAEYSLTENVASPFQAEPRHTNDRSESLRNEIQELREEAAALAGQSQENSATGGSVVGAYQ